MSYRKQPPPPPPPIASPPPHDYRNPPPRVASPLNDGRPISWGAHRTGQGSDLGMGLGRAASPPIQGHNDYLPSMHQVYQHQPTNQQPHLQPQSQLGGYRPEPVPVFNPFPTANQIPQPQLNNFEAAVAALRATGPSPIPIPHPVQDPNFPSGPVQFHSQPAYTTTHSHTSLQPSAGPSRPSVGPGSAAAQQGQNGEAPRVPSFYERTKAFFGGGGSGYSAPQEQSTPNKRVGRRNTMRMIGGGGGSRTRSRSPSPSRESGGGWGTDPFANVNVGYGHEPKNYGFGQFDEYGAGDVAGAGQKLLHGDDLDAEKADLSLYEESPNNNYPVDPFDQQAYSPDSSEDHNNAQGGGVGGIFSSITQHFGLPPIGRVMRRHKTKKKVPLTAGNLVISLKIPSRLEGFLPTKGEEEMMSTRYTAITCDPDDFIREKFTLRQSLYGRETQLFIVITYYNESAELLLRTLYGVMKNISHLTGRKNSSTWGAGSWKKVVVCIVADGRKHIQPRVLDCLASLGVYQDGAMKNSVQDKPVKAHMFEYTTSFALDPEFRFKYPDKGIVPTQIIFCLKENNAKKINSHRWFFNAFAKTLDPRVCILLDAGTRPSPKSIYHLWKAFDTSSQVGGACGEIATYKGKAWRSLLNPIVASQCFEYKCSNILDKPLESVMGYCAVLPGAFSAYRWLALQNDKDGSGPLASYFLGETLAGKDAASTFQANMYLAEDRILCWEIVAKPRCNYVLKYVKSAVAETDCPDTIAEFISQRRRWLNGSFFAAVYALTHVRAIFATDHSTFRKTILMLESVYNLINLVFSWFAIANFYIFFVIVTSSLSDSAFGIPNISILNTILQYLYVGTVIACFLFSMGNRPSGSKWKYFAAVSIFAFLTCYMIAAAAVCAVHMAKNASNATFAKMMISVLATYGVYVVSALLALDPFHLLTCFGQYILLQATYINVLNVYAFSNLHDLSWGTKGSDQMETDLGSVKVTNSGSGRAEVEVELPAEQVDVDTAYSDALDNIRIRKEEPKPFGMSVEQKQQQQKDYYANFRTNVLMAWVMSNGLLAALILGGGDSSSTFDGTTSRTSVYMLFVLIFVAGTSGFRFLGSCLYLLLRLFGA